MPRIDRPRGGFGDGLLLSHGVAEENLVLIIVAIDHSAEFVGEAPDDLFTALRARIMRARARR